MGNSLKSKIMAVSRKIETVHIPDLGLDVYIRRMSGIEFDVYQAAEFKAHEEQKTIGLAAMAPLQSLLISLTLCEADGTRVFEHAEEVKALDSIVMNQIGAAALAVNGMTEESRDAIEKKFKAMNPTSGFCIISAGSLDTEASNKQSA